MSWLEYLEAIVLGCHSTLRVVMQVEANKRLSDECVLSYLYYKPPRVHYI